MFGISNKPNKVRVRMKLIFRKQRVWKIFLVDKFLKQNLNSKWITNLNWLKLTESETPANSRIKWNKQLSIRIYFLLPKSVSPELIIEMETGIKQRQSDDTSNWLHFIFFLLPVSGRGQLKIIIVGEQTDRFVGQTLFVFSKQKTHLNTQYIKGRTPPAVIENWSKTIPNLGVRQVKFSFLSRHTDIKSSWIR